MLTERTGSGTVIRMSVLSGKRVVIDGTFEGLRAEELKLLVVAHGGVPAGLKGADLMLAGEGAKKRAEAESAGKPVVTLADLEPPLGDWFERLSEGIRARPKPEKQKYRNFGFGPPADDALVGAVMDRIGFRSLALESLMRSFNGLSYLWTKSSKPIDVAEDDRMDARRFLHAQDPMWAAVGKSSIASIAFPTWEEMFLDEAFRGVALPLAEVDGDTSVLEKKRPLVASQLFPLDYFHWNSFAALYADREEQSLWVLLADDHGADLTRSKPIPFRIYVESLLASGYLSAGTEWRWEAPGMFRAIRPRTKAKQYDPTAVRPFAAMRIQ